MTAHLGGLEPSAPSYENRTSGLLEVDLRSHNTNPGDFDAHSFELASCGLGPSLN